MAVSVTEVRKSPLQRKTVHKEVCLWNRISNFDYGTGSKSPERLSIKIRNLNFRVEFQVQSDFLQREWIISCKTCFSRNLRILQKIQIEWNIIIINVILNLRMVLMNRTKLLWDYLIIIIYADALPTSEDMIKIIMNYS